MGKFRIIGMAIVVLAAGPSAWAMGGKASGSFKITTFDLAPLQVTNASGIWSMSTGDILTVMETEGGTIGLRFRSGLTALDVYLGSVSGAQIALTSLDGSSTLTATVSGASMSGTVSQAGSPQGFSAARVLEPIGSPTDGVWQTDLNTFLLYFTSDQGDTLRKIVFEVALTPAGITHDIFLGRASSDPFQASYAGASVFGARTLDLTFYGHLNGNRRATGVYGGTTGFSAESLLRFCPNPTDFDGDGVLDHCDACPENADPGQADQDGDGVGDACDLCLGADDFADGDANGTPDCLAGLGGYANAGGSYSVGSFSRADCYGSGTRFTLELVPGARSGPGMDLCDLPENPGCQDTLIQGNTAVANSVQYANHGPHDMTMQISGLLVRGSGEDECSRKLIDFIIGDNFVPMECDQTAQGPFPESKLACRYIATFIGTCSNVEPTMQICIGCESQGCPDVAARSYTIRLGQGSQFRKCRATLERVSEDCGACEGLVAVP